MKKCKQDKEDIESEKARGKKEKKVREKEREGEKFTKRIRIKRSQEVYAIVICL